MTEMTPHERRVLALFLSSCWTAFEQFCTERGIDAKDAGRIIDDLQDDPL